MDGGPEHRPSACPLRPRQQSLQYRPLVADQQVQSTRAPIPARGLSGTSRATRAKRSSVVIVTPIRTFWVARNPPSQATAREPGPPTDRHLSAANIKSSDRLTRGWLYHQSLERSTASIASAASRARSGRAPPGCSGSRAVKSGPSGHLTGSRRLAHSSLEANTASIASAASRARSGRTRV